MLSLLFVLFDASAVSAILTRQQHDVVNMESLVRDTPEAKFQVARISRLFRPQDLPYAELRDVPGLPSFVKPSDIACFDFLPRTVGFQDLGETDLFLRGVMKPESVTNSIEIYPFVDEETINGGTRESRLVLTSSTSKIDSSRIGWATESAEEAAGIFSSGAGAHSIVYSAHIDATYIGNQRWSKSGNTESGAHHEFREDRTMELTCPPNTHCSAQTWTYMRTISGTCHVLPIVESTKSWLARNEWVIEDDCHTFRKVFSTDKNQTWQQKPSNVSLAGINNDCVSPLASKFFELSGRPQGFGDSYQGVFMHKPDVVLKYKHEFPCNFTYALRRPDGAPYRTTVILNQALPQKDGSDAREPSRPMLGRIPQAVGLNPKNQALCDLEDGWKYSRKEGGNWFQAANAGWAEHPDWPSPERLSERCPSIASMPLSKIAERSTREAKRAEVRVIILRDEIDSLISLSSETGYDAFAEPSA